MRKYKSTPFDTSEELLVARHGNGIKLMKPALSIHSNQTMGDLLRQPFGVFFSDTDNISVQCNEISAQECGYQSCNDIIGKKWHHYFKASTIAEPLHHAHEVIQKNITKITLEKAIRKDGSCNEVLAIKMPCYNEENKIIGLFGCAIIPAQHSLTESLAQIASLGFLNSPQIPRQKSINSIHLSKRELECLQLTVRGHTAKSIAKALKLSHWTIEEYISNIKYKFGVRTKAELVNKTIDTILNNSHA